MARPFGHRPVCRSGQRTMDRVIADGLGNMAGAYTVLRGAGRLDMVCPPVPYPRVFFIP